MDKALYLKRRKLKKWLTNNFDVKYVDIPCFVWMEIKGDQIVQKSFSVGTIQFESIRKFKEYFSERNRSKFFILRNQKGEIFEQFSGERYFRMRIASIERNRRYKIKTKSHE